MSKYLLFTCILLLHFNNIQAQASCGFDQRHQTILTSDPAYARQHAATDVQLKHLVAEQKHAKTTGHFAPPTVTIPVVVHVMHTGGAVGSAYNPSDDQIVATIDYLNKVYAGTFPGMTAPVEGGGVVNMGVQFALAERTPSCEVTTGIVRVNASGITDYVTNGSTFSNELAMKNLSRWDPSKYYNIWVVNKMIGAAGYAYVPGSSPSLDGTVLIADAMKPGDAVLPHEIGHALGLYHTFFGDCLGGDCTVMGDAVCDTDPVTSSGNCRTGFTNPCTGTPYTVNTENNIMGYSHCQTLFTNGQKARAQASLLLPSRSSLIDPSNLALIPCGSQIRFEKVSGSHAEDITAPTDGCRRYRDYLYTMFISEAPTATATATLTFGGTATRGMDYEVTCNGSFTSPGNVLTFNTGSSTPQSFIVRIYDDGQLESTENILLGFSLNSVGGNAIKGNKPALVITIADNDVIPDGTGLLTYNLGNGSSSRSLFDARLKSRRAQFQYKASELNAAGLTAGAITSLALTMETKLSTRAYQNLTIRLGHSTNPYLVVGGTQTETTGMTTVYSSPAYNTVSGINRFHFSTPFVWDGTSNITVEICFDNGTAATSNLPDFLKTYEDGGTSSEANYVAADVNCSQSFSPSFFYYTHGEKPDIQFGKNTPVAPVETALASITSLHMEPGSNDYFYSNNNKLMMKMGGISHPLQCVTATLQEAGNSWHSYYTGNRSAKVFRVLPALNAAVGSYSATFYFTNAELDGKDPALLSVARTTAASVAASNSGNTEFKSPVVSSLGPDVKAFTAGFTGPGLFFLVDGTSSLPVTLLSFTVKANDQQQIVLQWSTSSETRFSRFDIEHSTDALYFSKLGSMQATGSPEEGKKYQFIHTAPSRGVNYYRLKQIDNDETYEYSRTIAMNINAHKTAPVIYPNPAREQLHINFGRPVYDGRLDIYTADMRLALQTHVNRGAVTATVNLNQLQKGIYFIRVTDGSETTLHKFIRE